MQLQNLAVKTLRISEITQVHQYKDSYEILAQIKQLTMVTQEAGLISPYPSSFSPPRPCNSNQQNQNQMHSHLDVKSSLLQSQCCRSLQGSFELRKKSYFILSLTHTEQARYSILSCQMYFKNWKQSNSIQLGSADAFYYCFKLLFFSNTYIPFVLAQSTSCYRNGSERQ